MSVSLAEFDALQEQLLAVKSEKYELKERERKLLDGTRRGRGAGGQLQLQPGLRERGRQFVASGL